jgi:hypothetical protein
MTRALIFAALLLGLAQLVPVDRSNPAVESDIAAPAPVDGILRRACYDCHSHETRWPWYSYVAPVSWLVQNDVHEAREHLNFSTWSGYSPDEQREHLEEIAEEVAEGEMPVWYYLPLHPDARLSQDDVNALREWTQTPTATPS